MDKGRKAGSMKYSPYCGPVKSAYRSARSAMNLKKSSFLPSSSFIGHHDLVSRHMEAHFRRIVSVKGKTDTSAPESLKKCSKAKDQAKRLHHSLSRHPSLASLRTRSRRATQTPSQVSSKWWDSDAGFVSMTQSLESLNVVGCDQPDSGEGDLGFQIRKRDSQLCVPRARRDYQEAGDFGSCDMEETALVKETTASYPSMHSLRYRHLLESPVHEANQWQEYHTRTGQLTGYLQYKQRQTPRPSASERSIPWKPAFSANSPQSHHSNYPSLGESSSIHLKGSTSYSPPLKAVRESRQTIASKKARDSCLMKDTQGEATSLRTVRSSQLNSSTENEDGTVLLQKTVANNGDDTNSKSTVGGQGGQKAELHNISLATAAEETDVSLQPRLAGHGEQSITGPDHDGEKTTVDLPLPARAATEGPSLHSHAPRGKNILEGIAELSLQSQVANKRSHEARKRLEYRVQECEYLNFISSVTGDIRSRGILSNSALALLFRSHVERNRHRLREDIMLEKIRELKTDLGII